ncbi:MAG TPA: hypothetical protein VMB51_12760 [Solirubrobacteraceae bacterium]|nr:hypothetical protein [Solirubrobacteraceae bacterium]
MSEPSPERRAIERQRAKESRDELMRASLRPLAPGERPLALRVAVLVAGLVAVTVVVGALTIHGLSHRGGSLPGGLFIAAVFALLAWNMYRCRYWAVLSFEALLAFQIIVTSLALVVASTVLAAALCLVSIVLAGWLFWKLVRVMGRMQAQDRP